jgi:hypothetical protein
MAVGQILLPCLNTISKSPPPSLAIYSAGDLIGAGVGGAPATKCRVGSPAGGRGVEGGRGGLIPTITYCVPLLSEYTHAGHLQDKVAHKCAYTVRMYSTKAMEKIFLKDNHGTYIEGTSRKFKS